MNKLCLIPLCILFFLTGCATGPTVTIPRVPVWVPVQGQYTIGEVRQGALNETGLVPQTSDSAFTLVSHAWVKDVLPWTWEFVTATGLAYTAESFDCDKFAKAFTLACEISAGRAGVKAQPLVARIYVIQKHAFGGVAASGKGHALVAIATSAGLFVVEPQTRAITSFSEYPNRESIYQIKIGG